MRDLAVFLTGATTLILALALMSPQSLGTERAPGRLAYTGDASAAPSPAADRLPPRASGGSSTSPGGEATGGGTPAAEPTGAGPPALTPASPAADAETESAVSGTGPSGPEAVPPSTTQSSTGAAEPDPSADPPASPAPASPDPGPSDPAPSTVASAQAQLAWSYWWGRDPGVTGSVADWTPGRVVRAVDFGVVADDAADDVDALRRALAEAATSGAVVELPPGTIRLAQTITLTAGVVVRGDSSGATVLEFTAPLTTGVELAGSYPKSSGTVVQGSRGSTELVVSGTVPLPGQHVVLVGGSSDDEAGQVGLVVGQSKAGAGVRITLSEPLADDFGGATIRPFTAGRGIGLERVVLRSPSATVDYHVMFRYAADVWLRQVRSEGAHRSHVLVRQTSDCEIAGNEFVDASAHGDGGQGYGVNISNGTTGCLVEKNSLTLLRHSMLLHGGATANVLAFNHSFEPRHTNFVDGGPADISFHGYASANLVEGNRIERIQLADAGRAGRGNTMLRNCLTSGPLTLDNDPVDAVAIGNTMIGSNERLRARVMPPVEGSAARAYTRSNPFDDDGVSVWSSAPGLTVGDNWFAGRIHGPHLEVLPNSLFTANISTPPAEPTGDVTRDCPNS